MQRFLSSAPGVIWTAIITGLVLLADWLTQFYGELAWVPPVAGLLALVIVPVLKVLFADADADVRYIRRVRESKLAQWLL